jgi:succinate dehydrogenase / fumarate reductase cytochrome b subunit
MDLNSYETSTARPPLPKAFVQRRIHSLTGLFLVLFLFEHLLTNSQAALFLGEDGQGFINAVNFIQSLPYLPVIELTLLGVPIILHGWLGIEYLFSAKPNSFKSDGTAPSLGNLPRNQAYTWQRVTSIILVFGIFLHVVFMRFIHYPTSEQLDHKKIYTVKVYEDPGLLSVANRLGTTVVSEKEHEAIVQAADFGTATLFSVRDAFQSLWVCVLYTGFVLAACFHAMNGIWTFAISWGITLTERSRILARRISDAIMLLIVFLGLAAIWGTYWINLKN